MTYGVTITAPNGQLFQTWITTTESPVQIVNSIRTEYDGKP